MTLTTEQALGLWLGPLTVMVRAAGDELSARQMAVLLRVYVEPPPHTVRGLAAALRLSKPAISRALDSLGRRGLIRRAPDPRDKRSIVVQRTVKGSVYLRELADTIALAVDTLSSPEPDPRG
jgi:DNA-binding MarR family transcriptional regulator